MAVHGFPHNAQQPVSSCRNSSADYDPLRVQQINHIRQPETKQPPGFMHHFKCQFISKIISL
ncbi:hypothetical protein D3C72_2386960 [compost metagenome]